jgi:hypothetical protein
VAITAHGQLVSVAHPAIQDLLEHLPHPRPHQGAPLRLRLAVPAAVARSLSRVELRLEIVVERVVVHGDIVAARSADVNRQKSLDPSEPT